MRLKVWSSGLGVQGFSVQGVGFRREGSMEFRGSEAEGLAV